MFFISVFKTLILYNLCLFVIRKKYIKMKTVCVFNSYFCPMNSTTSFDPHLFLWPSSGGSLNPLWVHGWSSAQWQHRTDGPLLCYLDCGSHFPRFHSDAIGFRWFTHQKGKVAPWGQHLAAFMCKWGSLGLDVTKPWHKLGLLSPGLKVSVALPPATVVLNLKYQQSTILSPEPNDWEEEGPAVWLRWDLLPC